MGQHSVGLSLCWWGDFSLEMRKMLVQLLFILEITVCSGKVDRVK